MSDAGDLLREIIAGRSVPPTNAEVRVHAERGAVRWWPLSADGCPCAWPSGGE